jgi:hypothetical protein
MNSFASASIPLTPTLETAIHLAVRAFPACRAAESTAIGSFGSIVIEDGMKFRNLKKQNDAGSASAGPYFFDLLDFNASVIPRKTASIAPS